MLELMKLVLMLVMTQEGSPIRLAEVDASEEKVLAKREGVRSWFINICIVQSCLSTITPAMQCRPTVIRC